MASRRACGAARMEIGGHVAALDATAAGQPVGRHGGARGVEVQRAFRQRRPRRRGLVHRRDAQQAAQAGHALAQAQRLGPGFAVGLGAVGDQRARRWRSAAPPACPRIAADSAAAPRRPPRRPIAPGGIPGSRAAGCRRRRAGPAPGCAAGWPSGGCRPAVRDSSNSPYRRPGRRSSGRSGPSGRQRRRPSCGRSRRCFAPSASRPGAGPPAVARRRCRAPGRARRRAAPAAAPAFA